MYSVICHQYFDTKVPIYILLQPGQDKKPARVRKPRGKQPDPEPVILTLSSDEEDSNSSMINQVFKSLIFTLSILLPDTIRKSRRKPRKCPYEFDCVLCDCLPSVVSLVK